MTAASARRASSRIGKSAVLTVDGALVVRFVFAVLRVFELATVYLPGDTSVTIPRLL
jgi:hypothetical protein